MSVIRLIVILPTADQRVRSGLQVSVHKSYYIHCFNRIISQKVLSLILHAVKICRETVSEKIMYIIKNMNKENINT